MTKIFYSGSYIVNSNFRIKLLKVIASSNIYENKLLQYKSLLKKIIFKIENLKVIKTEYIIKMKKIVKYQKQKVRAIISIE